MEYEDKDRLDRFAKVSPQEELKLQQAINAAAKHTMNVYDQFLIDLAIKDITNSVRKPNEERQR